MKCLDVSIVFSHGSITHIACHSTLQLYMNIHNVSPPRKFVANKMITQASIYFWIYIYRKLSDQDLEFFHHQASGDEKFMSQHLFGYVFTGWLFFSLSDHDLQKVLIAYCPLWEDNMTYTILVP